MWPHKIRVLIKQRCLGIAPLMKETKLTQNIMTNTLKENYANLIIDGMDMDDIISFAFDSIMKNLEDYDENDVKNEILDLYDSETLDSLM